MSDNTFSPGPSKNTVKDANGKFLTAPNGWILLPPGDAAPTRRTKASGDHWLVKEKRGRRTFALGVWSPKITINRIREELEAGRSTEGFTNR